MAKHQEINVPYIEARNVGTKQKPTAIVLRISSTTSEKGAALGIAQYHHTINAPPVSHHFILDDVQTYRCIPDKIAAYSNPYRSLSVLICTEPYVSNPYWDLGDSLVLNRTATLVADLIRIHKIPVRYLDEKLEQKWVQHKWRRRGGIIVQAVGTWPYESFLSLVKLKLLEEE